MDIKFRELSYGSMKFAGFINRTISFVNEKQLYNQKLWKSFVDVYRTKEDNEDARWRCEYWGKMMRGACLCYKYENDPKLYAVLKETVLDMLSTQDEDGRISTYLKESEFRSWDMWGRKYIMTSLLHFYEICPEKDLKNKVLTAVKKHADYIVERVGKEDGQINITDTSEWWLGVNSSSILEPFVNLYNVTKEEKYLDFAGYIVNEGGIRNGNLIKDVEEGKLLPYQYEEAKAYETMSFFEGVFEYALAINDEHLFEIAIKFFELVEESEISVTGNAGSEDENFSHCSINQTVKPERFCQETCVVVTYMRIMHKLFLITGDDKYYERFIRSGLNSYLSSLNINNQSGYEYYSKVVLDPLPFDSYAPLVYDRHGVSTGGLNFMRDGSFYGCCTCIGSAGIGLIATTSILEDDESIYINDYFIGEVNNKSIKVNIKGDYIKGEKVILDIHSLKDVKLRIPSWSNPSIMVNGQEIDNIKGHYLSIGKGDLYITIIFNQKIVKEKVNDMVMYRYGNIVLGIDELSNLDITLEDIHAKEIKGFKPIECDDALVCFQAEYKGRNLIFKDYASTGKYWDIKKNRLTVFVKE